LDGDAMQALLFCESREESAVLTVILQQVGFSVRSVSKLDEAIDNWPDQPLDLMLASLSGEIKKSLAAVKQLRPYTVVPIVVIEEGLNNEVFVELLEAGVDLVVSRPYDARVLMAQIRSLLRRTAGVPFFSLPTLEQAGVVLDPANHKVIVENGEEKRLTRLEFRLLYTLMTHSGQIIPTENLVEHVWGYSGEGNRELVRGLVQRLRSKIEPNPHSPHYVLTEANIGYYFNRNPREG
jgi:DNA-binding response OmpR family regulator